MLRGYELLYDYQISDQNTLAKLLNLSPLPLMASINMKSSRINLWNLANLSIFSILQGHQAAISDICFSPASKLLISSSYTFNIKIWNPLSSCCLLTLVDLPLYRRLRLEVSFDQDATLFLMEASKNMTNEYPTLRTCDIFEKKIRKQKNSMTKKTFIADFVVLLSTSKRRVAYVLKQNIVIFNYELEFIAKTLKDPQNSSIISINCFMREPLTAENEFIISANTDNEVRIWNVFKAEIILTVKIAPNLGKITIIKLIPKWNFKFCILGTAGGHILIANTNEGRVEGKISDFAEEGSLLWSLLFWPEKNTLFSSGKQGKFKGFQIKFL